jgi:hypothetical protein
MWSSRFYCQCIYNVPDTEQEAHLAVSPYGGWQDVLL